MIKLKDILLEFVDRDITLLMDYINSSTQDKIIEVVDMVGGWRAVINWLFENDGDWYDVLYDYREYEDAIRNYDSLTQMKEEHPDLYDEIMDFMTELVLDKLPPWGINLTTFLRSYGIPPNEVPTWVYHSKPVIVKNQWLIHATTKDNLQSIFKDGFIRGVEDMTTLGLTTWYDGESFEKKGGGYNFAHTTEDFFTYGLKLFESGTKYGDGSNIVVFRASGLQCWHKTDAEYQVIFNGKTARDMVPISFLDGKWTVFSDITKPQQKRLFASDDVKKAIEWVQNNYDQYRKSIGWSKSV